MKINNKSMIMKQKANKYSSYFTPKILIAVAILLIIFDKSLFIEDGIPSIVDLIFVLLQILLYIILYVINIEFAISPFFTERYLVTTGTIGSIIIIAIGWIYFAFPIVDYNARYLNIPIDTHEISRARFGSKLLILSGFGLLLYNHIEFTMLYKFDLLVYLITFNNIYFISLIFLCIIGTILQKYNISTYPLEGNNKNGDFTDYYTRGDKYTEDINIIKNANVSNNSIIDWSINAKHRIDSEYELEWELLHIRNNVESFIHVLFWVCFLSGLMGLIILPASFTLLSMFFLCAFFLVVICPNAIDTKHTKTSRLITRLCGIFGVILTIGSYILFYYINSGIIFVTGPIVFILWICVIPLLLACLLFVIYARIAPKKYILFD